MTTDKGFTFFMNSNPKEIRDSLDYIVAQNDFFHTKIHELETQIKELTDEKNQFEDDNERIEKSLTGLRGITVNEFEMCKILEGVVKGYKETNLIQSKMAISYKNLARYNYIGVVICYTTVLLGFTGYMFSLCMATLVIIYNTSTVADIDNKLDYIKKIEQQINKEEEYNLLRENQDYIGKMIENM